MKDSVGGFGWRYADERFGANEEAEEGEKVENEAEGEDEAEDEREDELEDEGEDEAEDEDEDEEQLRPLSAATAAALRKRIRSLPKLRMRNGSQYRKILKLQTLPRVRSSRCGSELLFPSEQFHDPYLEFGLV